MKKDIHPDYHPVVFRDIGADYSFLTRSTAVSNQTVKWEDGNEYPLINIDISSKSHPFYTGQQRFGKARGRIESSTNVTEKHQTKKQGYEALFLISFLGMECLHTLLFIVIFCYTVQYSLLTEWDEMDCHHPDMNLFL